MKAGKFVVLAVSLALSLSAFADGLMGSGSRTEPAPEDERGGGTIGSGTRSGYLGSGVGIASDDEGDGGTIGSGVGRDGVMGSGYATIVSDELGGEYLVVSDGATFTVVQLN